MLIFYKNCNICNTRIYKTEDNNTILHNLNKKYIFAERNVYLLFNNNNNNTRIKLVICEVFIYNTVLLNMEDVKLVLNNL